MSLSMSRRQVLLSFLCGGCARLVSAPLPVEHFEKVRWFERKPGATQPRELVGNLAVNRKEDKLVFFARHAKLLEVRFDDIVRMSYEFAARPRDLEVPQKDWPRFSKKSPKHLLTVVYREFQTLSQREPGIAPEAESFLVVTTAFELPTQIYGEIISSIEDATGRTVQRLNE